MLTLTQLNALLNMVGVIGLFYVIYRMEVYCLPNLKKAMTNWKFAKEWFESARNQTMHGKNVLSDIVTETKKMGQKSDTVASKVVTAVDQAKREIEGEVKDVPHKVVEIMKEVQK